MKKSSLFFLVLFITSLSSYAEESVQVTNAWINEAPPMAKSLAGYMEIHNRTDKSIMLRNITSPNFELAEFHKTEIQDGMARMTPVSQVVIKPHSKISFEPGGLHMMLINPRKEIKKGEKIEITLHFPNDKELTFTAKVKKMSNMPNQSDHDMNHEMKMDKQDNHDMHEDREDMTHDSKPHKH